jgi:malonyl CoA-acyl carrier protein transacylase
MTNLLTPILDRTAETSSIPARTGDVRDVVEVVEATIPMQVVVAGGAENAELLADELDRQDEVRLAFVVSLGLLALFVVTFVSYLVLDAAHLA